MTSLGSKSWLRLLKRKELLIRTFFENMWIPGEAPERGAQTEGSGSSERMELTEIPDTYYFERKQILATSGLTGGFRLFWEEGNR